jgi:hypothetical protein
VPFLAWTLAYWIKQNCCLSKILNEPPQAIGGCKQAVASIIIVDSGFLLTKNSLLLCTTSNQNALRKESKTNKVLINL